MSLTLEMNPYLFGCLLLMGAWAAVLVALHVRQVPGNREEFWWSSFSCGLLGFSEPLFVPEYWSPPSILSVGRWDLESFVFCFAIGGIAAVMPEFPRFKEFFLHVDYLRWRWWRMLKLWLRRTLMGVAEPDPAAEATASAVRLTKRELTTENMLLVALFLGTFGFTSQLGLNVIYDSAITCVAMAVFIGWRSPKLRWQILGGGLTFGGIYAIVLRLVGMWYPTFYTDHWNLPALSGWWILGAPAEEYLFAFTLGLFWAPLHETWKDAANAPPPVPRVLTVDLLRGK